MRAGGDKCKMFGAAQSQFARGRAAGSSGRAADCCVAAGRASCPAAWLAGWLAGSTARWPAGGPADTEALVPADGRAR
mgnify:CR=1 FL=1